MKKLGFELKEEPYEEQAAAGRVNPSEDILITVNKKDYRLKSGHGTSDDLYVYSENGEIIVLSVNERLDYAGASRYDLTPKEKEESEFDEGSQPIEDSPFEADEEVFAQGSERLEEYVGKRGFDYAPRTIARRLLDYDS